MNYAVRLTFTYGRLQAWCSRVAMESEACVFYEHNADPANVHVHGLILGFRKDKKTAKNWIKEALRMSPKPTEWSFKEHQKDGTPLSVDFIAYMSKGKYDPSYVKGFTPEQIAEQKAKGYDAKKNNDEKPDKNELYWRGFDRWVSPQLEEFLVRNYGNDATFEWIRCKSFCYMMENVSLPMPHDIARHKACVLRLAWSCDVTPPSKSKYEV